MTEWMEPSYNSPFPVIMTLDNVYLYFLSESTPLRHHIQIHNPQILPYLHSSTMKKGRKEKRQSVIKSAKRLSSPQVSTTSLTPDHHQLAKINIQAYRTVLPPSTLTSPLPCTFVMPYSNMTEIHTEVDSVLNHSSTSKTKRAKANPQSDTSPVLMLC